MRILYLANLRLPTEKAYGIQIAKMCGAFVESGSDVVLAAPWRRNLITTDLFEYYGIPKNFKFKIVSAPDFYLPGGLDRIAFWVKNFISTVILSVWALFQHADVYYTRDESIAVILGMFRRRTVLEVHRFSGLRQSIFVIAGKLGVKAVVISRGLGDELHKEGFKIGNILTAPDGVDLRMFDSRLSAMEARNQLELSDNKKIILYAGHLFDWKGADILAEASGKIPDALMVFIGGTESDIKKFKDKYGSRSNIRILGHIPYRQVAVYLKAADVLVLPNKDDGNISSKYTSPLKMFEYMASGRPIVASDLPSIREILNENNAVLVKSGSPVDLADGISKLLSDAYLGQHLAAKAYEDVREYTWDKRVAKILKFIGDAGEN